MRLPTIAISALTAVVAGGIAVYHNYTHALDIAKDKLKEVSNSFDEASSVLNSYNSELNSNISRINELETLSGSKSLSSDQELEIARLKERNNLLRESIELQNEKVKAEAKELSEQNRKTFSKEFDMDKLSDSENIARDYLSSHDVPDATAYLNEKGSDISSLIVGYAINRQKLQELSSKDDSPANRAAISMLEENTQYITDSLNTVFFDTISELSDYKENLIKLMKSDGTFDNTADQSLWNSINAAEKYMYEITGKASTWNKHIFESIAGNSDFATDISALLSGEADTSVDSIDKLNKKLEESGLILEDGKSARDMFLEYLKNAGSGTAAVSESLSSVSSLFKESTNKLSSATLADLNAEASTLSSIRSLLDGSGSLNSSFLSQILQQFPEATDAVLKFSQGLMSSEELFNSLADIYAGDSRQYINSVLSKSAADRDFFNSIKTNYPVLFDKLAADTAAAANCQLDNVALLQYSRFRRFFVQHALHQLLVDGLAVAQLRNYEGHHSGNCQRKQLLVAGGHFHYQHGAGDRRADGGSKKRRHSNNHDVGGVSRLNPAKHNQNLGANAAAESADNEHRQEETAGNAATVADERKNQLACKKNQQKLQGYRCFGQMVDKIVAAAQNLRQEVTQNTGADKGKGNLLYRALEAGQAVKAADVQQATVKDNTCQTAGKSNQNDDAVIAYRKQL